MIDLEYITNDLELDDYEHQIHPNTRWGDSKP